MIANITFWQRRRIKCDEAEPECSHCWEKDLRYVEATPFNGSQRGAYGECLSDQIMIGINHDTALLGPR